MILTVAWRWPVLVVLTLQVACGCVFGKAGDEAPPTEPTDGSKALGPRGAEISVKWQDHMLAELGATTAATEAWGVFSEGGWSNAGQVMVLFSADRKTRRLLVVPSNKNAVGTDRVLTDAEVQSIDGILKEARALEDVDVPSFDGLVFEIVHARREPDGKPLVDKRVLLRNPGAKPTPAHDAVIAAFQKLKQT